MNLLAMHRAASIVANLALSVLDLALFILVHLADVARVRNYQSALDER